MEGEKCLPIIKSIIRYDDLSILDFSYCNIGDHGACIVSKFALQVKIKELVLIDNNIGEIGGEAIAFLLQNHECSVQKLNLRLNPLGSKSGNLILKTLLTNISLKKLILNACNIEVDEIIGNVIETCNLEELHLTNNPIGDEIGNVLLDSIKFKKSLKIIDLRMCKISSELQHKISSSMEEKYESKMPLTRQSDVNEIKLTFSKEFELYFNNISLYDN